MTASFGCRVRLEAVFAKGKRKRAIDIHAHGCCTSYSDCREHYGTGCGTSLAFVQVCPPYGRRFAPPPVSSGGGKFGRNLGKMKRGEMKPRTKMPRLAICASRAPPSRATAVPLSSGT